MRYELTRTSGFASCDTPEEALDNVRPPKGWEYRCRPSYEIENGNRMVYRVHITLHTLKELAEFQRDCQSLVIIGRNTIEIYDDWRE